jgi:VanZ family protein
MKSKNLHVGTRKAAWAWLPAVLWAATIFILSSLPGSAFPRTDVPSADKLVHLGLYAMMGALCARGLVLGTAAMSDGRRRRLLVMFAAAALAVLYGVSDEIHQLFVIGRSADWRDAVADACGGLLGSAITVQLWDRRRSRTAGEPGPRD